jgi:hypothetical protein
MRVRSSLIQICKWVAGMFFGPNAEELGAVWTLSDGIGAAIGTIGAKHDPWGYLAATAATRIAATSRPGNANSNLR